MVPSKPERHLASFRCIPPALKRSVDLFADELQVPVGYAARILLEFSLFEFRQGRLKMVPKMSPRGWTLYPEDSPRQSKPVSFRDIPDALFQDIQMVAVDLNWETGCWPGSIRGKWLVSSSSTVWQSIKSSEFSVFCLRFSRFIVVYFMFT
jgi:hypothetical protein